MSDSREKLIELLTDKLDQLPSVSDPTISFSFAADQLSRYLVDAILSSDDYVLLRKVVIEGIGICSAHQIPDKNCRRCYVEVTGDSEKGEPK